MEGMTDIIVGNVCSLCAMVTDSISGTRKKHQQILAVQMISQVFYGAGSIILKGYSSTAQNVVAILRNLAAMKRIRHKIIEWILILLGGRAGHHIQQPGPAGLASHRCEPGIFRCRIPSERK